MIIERISARKIKDSRGEDTIEVNVNGSKASAPNGKSKGFYEAQPYGESLDRSIEFFNNLEWDFDVRSFSDLINVERILKRNYGGLQEIGANALFAFESAILKALAKEEGRELWEIVNFRAKKFPIPVGNVIGGGLHSEALEVRPNFQEFLIIPRADSFEKNVSIMKSVYDNCGRILGAKEKNDEGAWLTEGNDFDTLDILNEARFEAKKKFKVPMSIGIDVAASSMYKGERYQCQERNFNKAGQLKHMTEIVKQFAVGYVEDPFEERDFESFAKFNSSLQNCLVVGDDLTVSSIDRLEMAKRKRAINAIILKPNQNGSLVQMRALFELCKKLKIKTIMSHRSGETMDDSLADYAFAFGADYIKCGVSTKWREAKLNRMIEIEKSFKK